MAPVAAGTAAALQPYQAVAIAKAAAAAAPPKAAQIVVAVSRAVPKSYRDVAVAVSDPAPGSGRAILAALSSAFPELKAGIDTALANDTGQSPSVGLALSQAGVVTLVPPALPGALPRSLLTSLSGPAPPIKPITTLRLRFHPEAPSTPSPDTAQPQVRWLAQAEGQGQAAGSRAWMSPPAKASLSRTAAMC